MPMITDNLAAIHHRIEQAATAAGRTTAEITLIAVSKRQSVALIQQAIAAGQHDFGENYLQEAKEKIARLGGQARFHFIGALQSNKAKDAATLCAMVHTVDRLKLARELNRHAEAAQRVLPVLVQVNVGREEQKGGVVPEKAEELLTAMQGLENLEIRGLMTMPPHRDNPAEMRPFFAALRRLGREFQQKGLVAAHCPLQLSMGMSGDFEVAIAEGATLVRVGTAIFGAR
jgi:hypothetical protein